MVPLTVAEIAAACGGRLDGADPAALVTAVVTDSRKAQAGALFVALRGEHADGHAFVGAALERGAVAALVAGAAATGRAIRVSDPLTALAAIATAARARLTATVIAITGSAGKTSTRQLTAAATAGERRTVASPENYNNEIGVPLTILSADEKTEVLVVEVGARGIGHIAALAPVARPDIAVVTNVGNAHVGMFGSIDATTQAKGELVEALGPDGIAVLNADDERVAGMRARTQASVVTFGRTSSADVAAEDVTLDADARASFTLRTPAGSAHVRLRMAGEHMVANALAAAAAAEAAGCTLDAIAAGLATAENVGWRMDVRDAGGRRILNDAYNASPESVAAALKSLVAMARGRPTWAVLGHMAELGGEAVAQHDRIGRLAVRLSVGNLVVVGESARALFEAARLEGMFGGEARFVVGVDEAIELLRKELEPDAVVLVKASRAAGLERVAQALLEEDGA